MSMTLGQCIKAHLIIHGSATTAAACSAVFGLVPVFGPVTGKSVALIVITANMCAALSRSVFHRSLDKDTWTTVLEAGLAQFVAGATTIKILASFIPIYGSAVNAAVSAATVEALGWGTCQVLEQGKDPSALFEAENIGYMLRILVEILRRFLGNLPPDWA